MEAFVPIGVDILSNNISSTDLIPKILGEKFLKTLLKSGELVSHLRENPDCGDKTPSLKSITGVLVFLNLYEFKSANGSQREAELVNCLRDMISITNYKFEKTKTSAFVIRVRDRDSDMAKKIANELVNQYFSQDLALKKRNYEKTVSYFSEMLAKTKIELEVEKKKLNQFLLSNVKFISSSATKSALQKESASEQLSQMSSSLIFEINELEKQSKKLVETLAVLVEAPENRLRASELLVQMKEKQVTLSVSRNILNLIERLSVEENTREETWQLLRQKVEEEIDRLSGLSSTVKDLLNEKNQQLKKVIADSKTLDEMGNNYIRKLTYYEQLKSSVDRKILEAGILDVSEPTIYSRATQPLIPLKPKIKNIFAQNAVIAIIIALLLIFVRQIFTQRVYHIKQLEAQNGKMDLISLSKKDLNLSALMSGNTSSRKLNANFLKNIKDCGSALCVIDIQESVGSSTHLSDNISLYFSNLLKQFDKSVLCCMNPDGLARLELSKKPGTIYSLSSAGDYTLDKDQISLTSFESRASFIKQKKLLEIGDGKFDKTLISVGDKESRTLKFDLIDKCDFFILVGIAGSFTFEQFKSFMIDTEVINEKYLGCVLVAK